MIAVNAGKMDKRITLQANAPIQDGYGQEIDAWSDLAEVWAERKDGLGADTEREVENEERVAWTYDRFVIRWRSDVSVNNRVLYNGLTYDLTSVKDLGRKDFLILHGRARADG